MTERTRNLMAYSFIGLASALLVYFLIVVCRVDYYSLAYDNTVFAGVTDHRPWYDSTKYSFSFEFRGQTYETSGPDSLETWNRSIEAYENVKHNFQIYLHMHFWTGEMIDTVEGPADEIYYQANPCNPCEQQTLIVHDPDTFYVDEDSALVVKYTPELPQFSL